MRGRADVILDQDGDAQRLAIVDYKVSDDPSRDATYTMQLQVYASAGRAEGLAVTDAWLHPLREGSRKPIDVSQPACDGALTRVAASLHRVRQGDLPARPSPEACGRCDFWRVCPQRAKDRA